MATVLVVDDRQVNRDLVRTVLGYHGHETLEAQGGAEALDLLHRRIPDVIVADVLMPGMDGYELARAIRADPLTRDVPVLFYTANYVESEIRPIAAAVGVDRIVSKSGDLNELIEAIDDTLGATPLPPTPLPAEEFAREHLRVVNAKLLEKIGELEQGARLNQMVDAIVAVDDDLRLPAMVRRIAVAAHSLVSASHTSLITVGGERGAAESVHLGTDLVLARRLSSLAAEGQDALHRSGCLVVPVHIDGQVWGNLLLRNGNGGTDFTASDLSLLETLARAAGVAVANSQLYDDARRRQAWLTASADVASTLLVSEPGEAMPLIAAGARRVIGTDGAWVQVATDAETVTIESVDGPLALELRGRAVSAEQATLFAEIISTGRPVVIDDAGRDPRSREEFAQLGCRAVSLLGVPLTASGRTFGVLFLGNEQAARAFGALDVEMARAFARRAAMTLEFARAEDDRQRLLLLEDRNRIARDLHDVVIQRLFGLGLRLERMRSMTAPELAGQLDEISDGLDETIDQIRNTIFSLKVSGEERASLRAELLRVLEPASFALGFAPKLRIEGPLDYAVSDDIAPHLLATVGEALSNVVRHAGASRVDVLIRAAQEQLMLRVSDDGRGVPETRTESGLANLQRRASDLGGAMRIDSGADGRGTVLTWAVPLRAVPAGRTAEAVGS